MSQSRRQTRAERMKNRIKIKQENYSELENSFPILLFILFQVRNKNSSGEKLLGNVWEGLNPSDIKFNRLFLNFFKD